MSGFKLPKLATIRKGITTAVSLASEAVAAGVLHGEALYITEAGIAVAGTLLTWWVPNAPKAPTAAVPPVTPLSVTPPPPTGV